MGRLSRSPATLAVAVAAAIALAGCGSGGDAELLPGATASQIDANLTRVEQLVAEGECLDAESSAAEIGDQVEALTGVDRELQRALAEGTDRLIENIATECEEAPEEAETVPTIEEAEAAEPAEKEKEKPKKEEKEVEEGEPETEEGPTLPPQSNGKGEENGQGEGPPVEPGEGPPSGGVGPGTPAEGE